MKNTYSLSQTLIAVALLTLLGCVNPYRANFNSTKSRYPNWLETRFSAPAKNPQLVLSNDIQSENWKQFEHGYIMIGFSKFDGPDQDTSLALSQAKSVGADMVLVQKTYARTLTETVTVTNWPASETVTSEENTRISGARGTRQIETETETTTAPGPETSYVPKQVDYYEYSATFWRKLEKPIFGAFVKDLSDDLKQKLQSNHGLVVNAIVADSPAATADILKGDILLKIDGNPVPSAKKFYEGLAGRAGQSISLSVLRGDKTFDRRVTLNP